jgi:hypothetical protein
MTGLLPMICRPMMPIRDLQDRPLPVSQRSSTAGRSSERMGLLMWSFMLASRQRLLADIQQRALDMLLGQRIEMDGAREQGEAPADRMTRPARSTTSSRSFMPARSRERPGRMRCCFP